MVKVCWITTLVVCWLAAARLTGVHSELFTAVVHLERMLNAEADVAEMLKSYVKNQRERLATISKMAKSFERHSSTVMENGEKYLSNPVVAFLMVKRFTADWDDALKTLFNQDDTKNFLNEMWNKIDKRFPDNEDLDGAVDALLRLQDLYQLTPAQVASGQMGLQTEIPQTVSMKMKDCLDLARISYDKQDYYHTVMWMEHAMQQLQHGTENITEPFYSRTHALILDYLAFSTFQQGGTEEAMRLNEQLLTIEPDNERAASNKGHYQTIIEENQKQQQKDGSAGVAEFVNKKNVESSKDFVNYERLCRGEETRRRVTRSLSCQFRRHKPLFYIQPAREEVLHAKPLIVLYHNAVSDTSIERIREIATPRLKRATVQNSITGQLEPATYRVSKSAWLKDKEDVIVRRISELSGAISNLTLDTVEQLQVVNYGIGGHYEPHYDHARKTDAGNINDDDDGNRIATFMCYLTDVEAGGVTAFNLAGARVVPEKGACVIWYNLLKNGDGDVSTRHAACPVLVGSKWVMNKWFHERGQEFCRRCAPTKSV